MLYGVDFLDHVYSVKLFNLYLKNNQYKNIIHLSEKICEPVHVILKIIINAIVFFLFFIFF